MKFQPNEFIKTKYNYVYMIYGTVSNQDTIPCYRLRGVNFQKPTLAHALCSVQPETYPVPVADNEWKSLGFDYEAVRLLFSK